MAKKKKGNKKNKSLTPSKPTAAAEEETTKTTTTTTTTDDFLEPAKVMEAVVEANDDGTPEAAASVPENENEDASAPEVVMDRAQEEQQEEEEDLSKPEETTTTEVLEEPALDQESSEHEPAASDMPQGDITVEESVDLTPVEDEPKEDEAVPMEEPESKSTEIFDEPKQLEVTNDEIQAETMEEPAVESGGDPSSEAPTEEELITSNVLVQEEAPVEINETQDATSNEVPVTMATEETEDKVSLQEETQPTDTPKDEEPPQSSAAEEEEEITAAPITDVADEMPMNEMDVEQEETTTMEPVEEEPVASPEKAETPAPSDEDAPDEMEIVSPYKHVDEERPVEKVASLPKEMPAKEPVAEAPVPVVKAAEEPKSTVAEPGQYFSLEELKSGVDGVDWAQREQYLSPSDFEEIFKTTKEEFSKLKKWRQAAAKKKVGLF